MGKDNEDGKGNTFSFSLPVKTTKEPDTSVLPILKTLPSTHNSTVILFLGLKIDSTKVPMGTDINATRFPGIV